MLPIAGAMRLVKRHHCHGGGGTLRLNPRKRCPRAATILKANPEWRGK